MPDFTPLVKEYTFRRGDHFIDALNFKSASGASFWGGWVAKAQLRTSFSSDILTHEFDLGGEVSEVDGVGILKLTLEIVPGDSMAIAPGKYFGDLELTSGAFPKITPVVFRIHILPDVTRGS